MPEAEIEEPQGILHLLTDKFKANFEKKWRKNKDGCWIWTAARDKDDYGQVAVGTGKGRIKRAHRVSYVLYSGEEIPEEMDIDHTCHMRRCVNPEHLEVVTHKENMKNLRKKDDWAEDDEDFGERAKKKVSAQLVLEEALEILQRSGVEEKGGGFQIVSAEGTPWRTPTIRDGRIEDGKMSRVKLFLDVVRLGVDWKVAAKYILEMSAFGVYDWSSNLEWREDFAAAKKEGKRTRYGILEELHLDELERKIDFADFKDIATSLKTLREQDEDRIAIKKGQESGGNMPNVTIIFGTGNSEKALRTLVEMGDEIEAEFKVVEPKALKDGESA